MRGGLPVVHLHVHGIRTRVSPEFTTEKSWDFHDKRRTRNCWEKNTLGLLAARWKIFNVPLKQSHDTVVRVVMACICLHNVTHKSWKAPQYILFSYK